MNVSRDLIELQEVDLGILRDRKALESIPEMAQIQEVRSKLKELGRRTTKIVGMLKDKRIEREDNDGRRATLTRRIEEVNLENSTTADFRRIQSNNSLLDHLAKRLEKVDFNQKGVEEEIARLEDLYRQALGIEDSLRAKERSLLLAFRDKAHDLRDDLERLTARREALVDELPESIVERYAASCEAHNHVGVSRLDRGTCSGCGVEMQTSQLDALRLGPAIATCPVCRRILVVREED